MLHRPPYITELRAHVVASAIRADVMRCRAHSAHACATNTASDTQAGGNARDMVTEDSPPATAPCAVGLSHPQCGPCRDSCPNSVPLFARGAGRVEAVERRLAEIDAELFALAQI